MESARLRALARAPVRVVGLMMGVWFLGASIGNFLGGQAASFYGSMPLTRLLTIVAIAPAVCPWAQSFNPTRASTSQSRD